MPSSFAAVIKRIDSLPNSRNRQLIHKFTDFMKNADISEKYQKDNLFVIILFAMYLGDRELSGMDKPRGVMEFLDTRRKDLSADPERKWIRTWNDYLQRI